MSLSLLRVENLRCLPAAELVLHPGANLIVGANGSGKTTLLEAAYLLGRGRSFRTRYTEQLIRHGADRLGVAGRVHNSGGTESGRRLDLQCVRGAGASARIEAQPVSSFAELAEAFAVQVIDPGIHRLLEEGPARRRRWLDWAVFHVEPGFVTAWQQYTRALRQRNAALEVGSDPLPWEAEMIRYGESLSAARCRTMSALLPLWAQTVEVLGAPPTTPGFERGWPSEETLAESLDRRRAGDRKQRRTRYGPHRFDVVLRAQGRAARDVVSRGQQKLLGASMVLTVMRYVAEVSGRTPTLLLDDPAAELDEGHARALLAAANQWGAQRIVTALAARNLPELIADRVFHVERGAVKTV